MYLSRNPARYKSSDDSPEEFNEVLMLRAGVLINAWGAGMARCWVNKSNLVEGRKV
jgi:hypothetical protein